LNENLVWLVYLASGAIGFALVRLRGWRITPSMITGTVVAMVALWLPLHQLTPRDETNYWFQVDLALNASFCAIFAGAGAAIAYWLQSRDSSGL
jgi:uncharacterized membrane-anchored protein YitT (DUF2179 family)